MMMMMLFVLIQVAAIAVHATGSVGPDDFNELTFEEQSIVAKDSNRLRPRPAKKRPSQMGSTTQVVADGATKTKKHHVACEMRLKDAMAPQPPALPEKLRLAGAAEVPCVDGFAGGYPCENINLLSILTVPALDLGSDIMDLWGWVATDGSGREFALITARGGTVFVEVTDPINPIIIGRLSSHTSSSSWGDIKTYGNYAYKVSEASGHGMQIFDLTQLLTATPGTTFSETGHYGAFGNAHNVFVNEDTGYAYAVGTNMCNGGLHIVNLNNNPTNPPLGTCFGADGYTHDVQCVVYNGNDSTYVGREICFASNEDTVTIIDVTDKSNLVQLARKGYSGSRYTHQGWLTDDHNYFLFNDELDEYRLGTNTETHVLDVRDLNNPIYVGAHFGTTKAIDHNLYIKGDLVFEANYRAGLQVLRMNNIASASMEQVGYFDVFPSSNSANFNGAWSNYPYLPSGNILISGIEEGLFVVRLQLGDDDDACGSDSDCDDGVFCNGAETCNLSTGTCEAGTPVTCECSNDADCDDGVFCNGAETCNLSTGTCKAGDPVFCECLSSSDCDDGIFCNGAETCDLSTGTCEAGVPVTCECLSDSDCDDGQSCNGVETCNPSTGTCVAGDPVVPCEQGSWSTINFNNFESGYGIWNRSNTGNVKRRTFGKAFSGSYILLVKNTHYAYTDSITNASTFDKLRVEYSFVTSGLSSGESFFLEVNDGSGWKTIVEKVMGTDFVNNTQYPDEVEVLDPAVHGFAMTSNLQIRFRMNGNFRKDKLYLDDVKIEGFK